MISACRDLTDYVRAGEWTKATEKWCEKQSISGFPGICRVHRAEVVAMSGAWDQAEAELERATTELEAYNATPPRADGLYSLAAPPLSEGESRSGGGDIAPVACLGPLDAAPPSVDKARPGKHPHGRSWDQVGAPGGVLGPMDEDAHAPRPGRGRHRRRRPAIAREAAEELDGLVETFDTVTRQGEAGACLGEGFPCRGRPGRSRRPAPSRHRAVGKGHCAIRDGDFTPVAGPALRAVHDDDQADLELDAAFKDLDTLGAKRDADAVAAEIAAVSARRSGPTQTRRTFVFTDIVGSTKLAELLGDQSWDQLLRWHDDTLRELFVAHGGEVVTSTGDGFFVAFETSAAAVDAAVPVQRRLAEHRRSTGFAPMVRIGLHAAEANRHGSDYSGVGVHAAARVAALAQGGEILATMDTVDGVSDLPTSEPKEAELKGIDAPVQVVAVDWH